MSEDFELTLFDRLEVIKTTIAQVGEDNCYISFSGGKDSTVLHHMVDEALPDNNIPRIYINTGIEYNDIVAFVKSKCETDPRFKMINSGVNIKKTLEEDGYPFKSKEHSHKLGIYQKRGRTEYIHEYIKGIKRDGKVSKFKCPNKLLYQFESQDSLPFKVSEKCCTNMKKKPARQYEKETKRKTKIVGLRQAEGGERANQKGCVVFGYKNSIVTFKPLNPCSDEFIDWYIDTRKIELCKLYYPPYNFERTGCKGCPFNINIQKELDVLSQISESERRQCEYIWQPVYNEYRRIGYRLKKVEQETLF